jgi:hypothetical protein
MAFLRDDKDGQYSPHRSRSLVSRMKDTRDSNAVCAAGACDVIFSFVVFGRNFATRQASAIALVYVESLLRRAFAAPCAVGFSFKFSHPHHCLPKISRPFFNHNLFLILHSPFALFSISPRPPHAV